MAPALIRPGGFTLGSSNLSQAQLEQLRNELIEKRLSGVLSVTDQNGERIQYKTDADMAAAIEAVNFTIESLSRASLQSFTIKTSKGL